MQMAEKTKWVVRTMNCPGEKKQADLLIEWKVQKGKNVLQSVTCNCSQLIHYSGANCQWDCLDKISRKRG
jgi:hypothetical protein